MQKLLFGTAGIPMSTSQPNTINGIKQVKALSLGAMELEFVHSIHISREAAPIVQKTAKDNDIILTTHCPYYINLNSEDRKKLHASINYIVNSAKIASLCGVWSVCFHAGYYQKQNPEKVYTKIASEIKKTVKDVKEFDPKIWVRPELSGKLSQFGSLKELIKLSQEIEQVLPGIDFAHLHARENGKYNSYDEFCSALSEIEQGLGRSALDNMHIHVSGINYSVKGERNHMTLENSDLNYKALIQAFRDFKIKGVVISESPNIEKDALLMKKTFNS